MSAWKAKVAQNDRPLCLKSREEKYFGRQLGDLEPEHGRRETWAVDLYHKLCSCSSARTSSVRLMQVRGHFVTLYDYVGEPSFVDEVLLNPHPLDGCPVEETLKKLLLQETDCYSHSLLHRLEAYALTRQTVRRWFNFGDGLRLCGRASEKTAAFSGMFDSLIHVHKEAVKVRLGTLPSILSESGLATRRMFHAKSCGSECTDGSDPSCDSSSWAAPLSPNRQNSEMQLRPTGLKRLISRSRLSFHHTKGPCMAPSALARKAPFSSKRPYLESQRQIVMTYCH